MMQCVFASREPGAPGRGHARNNARFCDESGCAVRTAGPERLTGEVEYLGLLFESMVIRDLRTCAQVADAQAFRYREKEGLEVDAVVEAADDVDKLSDMASPSLEDIDMVVGFLAANYIGRRFTGYSPCPQFVSYLYRT